MQKYVTVVPSQRIFSQEKFKIAAKNPSEIFFPILINFLVSIKYIPEIWRNLNPR